jgi:lipoprotein-anchoring transpeptidase ErfK/SrfK
VIRHLLAVQLLRRTGSYEPDDSMLTRGTQAHSSTRRHALLASIAGIAALALVPVASPAGHAPPQLNIVAQARGHAVWVYRTPESKQPFITLYNPTAEGAPLTFLVKQRVPGWEQVYLPVRPNESTGWIRDRSVDLALDPYRVEVSLSRHRITVWKGRKVIHQETAGVGRTVLPTPHGVYFLVVLLKQANPNGLYGPYAFGTSAFSNKLYHFGAGPGQIGFHGTDDPARLGTNVSHGCIRISNAGIARLASLLPLGTPFVITP